MKLQYLGTAAAEGWPALFCACRDCREARERGGRNIRTRSQSIVDDRLLIDFPSDAYWHSMQFGVRLEGVGQILFTHSHEDHFYPDDLLMRMPPYAHGDGTGELPSLHLYGNDAVISKMLDKLTAVYGAEGESEWRTRIRLHPVKPFEPFLAADYRVTPLPTDHMKTEQAVIYLIEREGKRLLYSHDTGALLPETKEFLRGVQLNAVSMDCTFGAIDQERGHMGFSANRELREWMLANGCADRDTVFVSNHFSHNGTACYDRMCEIAEGSGILISYDGMTVEF